MLKLHQPALLLPTTTTSSNGSRCSGSSTYEGLEEVIPRGEEKAFVGEAPLLIWWSYYSCTEIGHVVPSRGERRREEGGGGVKGEEREVVL